MSRIAMIAVFLMGAVALTNAAHDPAQLKSFNEWRAKFNKNYANDVAFDHAFHNYVATLRRTELKNLAQSKAKFGPTLFADLSPEEFRAQYLNLNGTALREAYQNTDIKVAPPQPLPKQFNGQIPSDFNWATINNSPVT